MDDTQILYTLGAGLQAEWKIAPGTWFGKPCLKVIGTPSRHHLGGSGKVFAALWGGDMAFKLTGEAHAEALRVPGTCLFDPRGQGHPLKEWVLIPKARSSTWDHFARLACRSVAGAAQDAKEELIQGLVTARRKVLEAARLLSPEKQDQVFLGMWSVKDLLAHLAGWDDTNRQAVQEVLAGQKPSFMQYHDRDWKSYNARLVAEYRREDWTELVADVVESHQKLIGFLEAIPPDEYVNRKSLASLLRTEAEDEEEHARQVEAFRER